MLNILYFIKKYNILTIIEDIIKIMPQAALTEEEQKREGELNREHAAIIKLGVRIVKPKPLSYKSGGTKIYKINEDNNRYYVIYNNKRYYISPSNITKKTKYTGIMIIGENTINIST